MSYSIYLTHWPIVVIYKATRTSQLPLSLLEFGALFLATILIAHLLYRYVEVPFRHIKYLEPRAGFKMSITSFCALLAPLAITGYLIYSFNGVPQRFSKIDQQTLKSPTEQNQTYVWKHFNEFEGKDFLNNGTKRALIIGDSQAADLLNIIEETIPNQLDISTALIPVTCQAVTPKNSEFYDKTPTNPIQKREYRERQNNLLKDKRVALADNIIISSAWTDYGIDQIPNTIQTLTRLNPNTKLIIIPPKAQGKGGIDVVFLSRWNDIAPERIAFSTRTPKLENKRIRLIENAHGAQVLDIEKYICNWNNKTCSVFSSTGDPIFFDVSHITKSGAIFLGDKIQKSGELEVFN